MTTRGIYLEMFTKQQVQYLGVNTEDINIETFSLKSYLAFRTFLVYCSITEIFGLKCLQIAILET